MAKFEIERQIESCYVSKDLLKQLEDYLINKIPKLTGNTENLPQKYFSLSIIDNAGLEEMSSILNYSMPLFPDTTSRITLRFYMYTPNILSISIDFNKKMKSGIIRIAYETENAREIVLGIYEGIRRIIEPHKNINKIFYPCLIIELFTNVLIAIAILFTLVTFITEHYSIGLISLLILLLLAFYTWFGRLLKPYISFESNRDSNLKKWSDWFIKAFLAFIIFGTLLVLLRKKFLGF